MGSYVPVREISKKNTLSCIFCHCFALSFQEKMSLKTFWRLVLLFTKENNFVLCLVLWPVFTRKLSTRQEKTTGEKHFPVFICMSGPVCKKSTIFDQDKKSLKKAPTCSIVFQLYHTLQHSHTISGYFN